MDMVPFRYLKPGYVALGVTNLERSVAFYRDIVGLTLEERQGDELAFLRCSDDHHNVVLYQAADAGIKRMAFQLETPGDVPRARDHLQRLGWPVETLGAAESQSLRQGETIRFRIPGCGLMFEFYGAIDRASVPWQPTVAKIQRLGHVVIGAKDAPAVLDALLNQLNFRVSDQFGPGMTFLRCFPNPYHHSFGVAQSDADRFHHVNFMVSDIDDVGRATNRLKKNNVEIVFGPGRHDISDSIFLYFLDPDGMTTEYSFGMEEFGESDAREARKLPLKPEILDSWGGMPAPVMGKRGVIEKSTT
jgi:2,3-dihydroxy-p-cumate/2,3-dihydroxybenzoate 3,4-dioxygenase